MKQEIDTGLRRTCSPLVFFQLEVLEGQPQMHIHHSYQLVYLKNLTLLHSFLKKKEKDEKTCSIRKD